MHKKIVLLLILCAFVNESIMAQKSQVNFYEFIKGDSVRMFFNEGGAFTDKSCAVYNRYIRIDSAGDFNSHFIDIDTNKVIIGTGYYNHGQKQGNFEVFYPSGKLKCKGNFFNNIPYGTWEFFYESGLPDRTLLFSEEKFFLQEYHDEKGNQLVIDGFGKFKGLVAGTYPPFNHLIAGGMVENGKPTGIWKSYDYEEEFLNGDFIKGTYQPAKNLKAQVYYDNSVLNTFFLRLYFFNLEAYNLISCPERIKNVIINQKYDFDMNNFKSELHRIISDVIEDQSKRGEHFDYGYEDKALTIQFNVNKKGKAENFKLLSSWGQPFLYSISRVISINTKFPPVMQKTMYFHLKFHTYGGGSGQYTFRFSNELIFD